MPQIVVIAHNLRSTHNVGSLLRTADGLGIKKVYLTGYTPYPLEPNDKRLPHLSAKITKDIHKTALGAETSQKNEHRDNVKKLLAELSDEGYKLVALEQSPNSVSLPGFKPSEKIALLIGREVEGIELEILKLVDQVVEIPMKGKKESFNVIQAAAMALFHISYSSLS